MFDAAGTDAPVDHSPDAVVLAFERLDRAAAAAPLTLETLVAGLLPKHVLVLGIAGALPRIVRDAAGSHASFALSVVTHDAEAALAIGGRRSQGSRSRPLAIAVAPIVETHTQPPRATYHRRSIRLAQDDPPDVIVLDGPPPALGGRAGAVLLAIQLARRGTILLVPRASDSDSAATIEALRDGHAGNVEACGAVGPRGDIAVFVVLAPLPDPDGPDPATLLPGALAMTPRPRPTLGLIGVRSHYERSELRLLEGRDFDLVHLQRPADVARLPGDRPVAFLRWAPDRRAPIPADLRAALPAGVVILNDTHFDGAKSNVEAAFERVSGYPLRLDPHTHVGPALRKSEEQATHDGVIVDLPIADPLPGHVYQRVVASEIGLLAGVAHHLDIRVPVIGGAIPYVSVKIVPAPKRFGVRTGRAAVLQQMFAPGDLLGDDEIALILRFCQEIGLDFGALDVMRDARDGRIYIVDANDTPSPADGNLSAREIELRRRLFARALRERLFGLKG